MVSKAARYTVLLLTNSALCTHQSCAIIVVLQVSTELLQQYLDLEKNVILRFFLRFAGKHLPLPFSTYTRVRALNTSVPTPGMRERLLGDPGFPVKLSIEVGIGVTMKLLAEISKRGDNFNSELDLVFANVVMAIIADTMLVWLPAPRAATSSQKAPNNQTAIGKWLKSCPDNAFQVSNHMTMLL